MEVPQGRARGLGQRPTSICANENHSVYYTGGRRYVPDMDGNKLQQIHRWDGIMSIMGQIELCQLEDNVYYAKYRLEGLFKLRVQIRGMSSDFDRLNPVVTECIHEADADLERHRQRLQEAKCNDWSNSPSSWEER